jgi:hypothetical protein
MLSTHELAGEIGPLHLCSAGEGFKARAYRKSAGVIAGYEKKVESGKELKNLAGIGKATIDKVWCSQPAIYHGRPLYPPLRPAVPDVCLRNAYEQRPVRLQIDEFITTGSLKALEEADGFAKPAGEGEGEGEKPKAKGNDAMALKFL